MKTYKAPLHYIAVEKIFPLLEHERQAVRKRTIQAIQKLSQSASSQIQSDLLTQVISSVQSKSSQPELQKTILQTLSTLVTSRSSALIVPIVGLISDLCQSEDDELKESAITTIDAILRVVCELLRVVRREFESKISKYFYGFFTPKKENRHSQFIMLINF